VPECQRAEGLAVLWRLVPLAHARLADAARVSNPNLGTSCLGRTASSWKAHGRTDGPHQRPGFRRRAATRLRNNMNIRRTSVPPENISAHSKQTKSNIAQ
jgi:hypothetical protein